jgi:microcystin-dependent protein
MVNSRRRPLLVTDLHRPERRNFLKRTVAFLAGGALLAGAKRAHADAQGLDPFIGEIAMVGFNFAPRGWAMCDGQLLPISSNTALFALLGTTYGGDGRTTFGLPDLRGRFPTHMGTGPGLSTRQWGSTGGAEQVTMTAGQMPTHSHVLSGQTSNGTSDSPAGGMLARDPAGTPGYGDGAANVAAMHASSIGTAGLGQPQANMPPFLTINFVIALEGIFPSRN